jgi:transposase-like protein
MQGSPHPAETVADAIAKHRDGASVSSIAESLGISPGTVDGWVDKHRNGLLTVEPNGVRFGRSLRLFKRPMQHVESPAVRTTQAAEVENMELAALRQQIADLQKQLATAHAAEERPPVTGYREHPTPVDELWRHAEDENAKYIKRAIERVRFSADFRNETAPIGVTAVSDQHVCAYNVVDLKRMREDAELIASTDGLYAVLAGDGVDNHIKHRSAMLAARSQPDEQFRLFEHYLQIFASKILVMLSGNHDLWTDQIAGVDMMRRLAEQHRVCYSPHEARIDVQMANATYQMAVRHQYRYGSSLNQCHTVKRWYDMGTDPFDIGVIGHHHESAVEEFERHGQSRWAARPGSYQIQSSYSAQGGFNPATPTCPTFILFPDRRLIVGFGNIRAAVEVLKAFRRSA